jgi:hypothetical protein
VGEVMLWDNWAREQEECRHRQTRTADGFFFWRRIRFEKASRKVNWFHSMRPKPGTQKGENDIILIYALVVKYE